MHCESARIKLDANLERLILKFINEFMAVREENERITLFAFIGSDNAIERKISKIEPLPNHALNVSDGGHFVLGAGIDFRVTGEGGEKAESGAETEEAEPEEDGSYSVTVRRSTVLETELSVVNALSLTSKTLL